MTTSDPSSSSPEFSPAGIQRVFQSRAETAAFYNKIARVYDLLAEHSERPVRQTALEKLAPRPAEQVLEIGFGTGHCLIELARAVGPGGRAFGVDLSSEMVRLTAELAEKEGLADRVELMCGDATALPFVAESLDAILMTFTLELFDTPDIPTVLAQCRRVLRPGGRLCVAGMSKEDANGVIFELYEWSHRHFPNFVDCRPIFVRRSIEAAGFQVSDATRMSIWVPVEVVLARRP